MSELRTTWPVRSPITNVTHRRPTRDVQCQLSVNNFFFSFAMKSNSIQSTAEWDISTRRPTLLLGAVFQVISYSNDRAVGHYVMNEDAASARPRA